LRPGAERGEDCHAEAREGKIPATRWHRRGNAVLHTTFKLVTALALALLTRAAVAEEVADFYAAHPLRITVASEADGAYAAYTRTLAAHMVRYLPGHPAIRLRFMGENGGLAAAHYIADAAPRDGSEIAALRASNLVDPLLDPAGAARYDPRTLGWIGNISQQHGTCFSWATRPVPGLEEARRREITVGASSLLANGGTIPRILNALLGTHFRIVTGYATPTVLAAALESGAVEALCGISYSTILANQPDWVDQKRILFFAQTGLERHKALPEVPLVIDYATSDSQRLVLRLLDARERMGRPYAAPGGVPADRLAALRQAFDRTMQDPDYRAEAARRHMDVDPSDHDAMSATVAEAYAMPPEILAEARKLLAVPAK
jgi:hypothetical protein